MFEAHFPPASRRCICLEIGGADDKPRETLVPVQIVSFVDASLIGVARAVAVVPWPYSLWLALAPLDNKTIAHIGSSPAGVAVVFAAVARARVADVSICSLLTTNSHASLVYVCPTFSQASGKGLTLFSYASHLVPAISFGVALRVCL